MSDAVRAAASDLEFVKNVVERREREGRRGVSPRWLAVMWGIVVLAGCVWNEFWPRTCWVYWMVVPAVAFGVSLAFGGRGAMMGGGEIDREIGKKMGMHWVACFVGAVPVVLMGVTGRIGGNTMGQLLILVSGIVYYLGGVHFDRRWVAPGLVMMAGAVILAFLERWGWVTVGVAVCVTLVVCFWREPGQRMKAEG